MDFVADPALFCDPLLKDAVLLVLADASESIPIVEAPELVLPLKIFPHPQTDFDELLLRLPIVPLLEPAKQEPVHRRQMLEVNDDPLAGREKFEEVRGGTDVQAVLRGLHQEGVQRVQLGQR